MKPNIRLLQRKYGIQAKASLTSQAVFDLLLGHKSFANENFPRLDLR